ncbi:MAG: protein translocase subunit SecD [Capsulimonadaceae bacterium]
MKQQKVWLPVLIGVLILASLFVNFYRTYDAHAHKSVFKYPIKFGLDINGGVRAILQADVKALPPGTPYDATLVQRILTDRINGSGVAEATIQPKSNNQFVIELPDVHDKGAILERLGTTASMDFYYFKDVSCTKDQNRPISASAPKDPVTGDERYSFYNKDTHQTFRDGAQIRADLTKLMESGTAVRPGATPYTITGPLADNLTDVTVNFTADQKTTADKLVQEMGEWQSFLADSPKILTGADILPKSQAQMGGTGGLEPVVTQEFDSKGADEMGAFTGQHVGEIMGIVLDDRVLSAPVIQSQIMDQGEISGGFASLTEAQDLANLLNAGALPVPMTQVYTESVEATLGHAAVQKSILAGVVGLLLVLAFMIYWYRLPGVLADVALLIYALFAMAIYRGGLAWLSVPAITLTLPGIAGFILSIGMAVDANILIFERLKEELRDGKTLKGAIDAGFRRAFPAIRDSNICTLITCTVLYSMGASSVKGFALTLGIGVVVSLFSAITVTRTLLYALVDAGVANDPALFGYKPGPSTDMGHNWNIIGNRNKFYLLSVLIIVPGLIFLGIGGLKQGIDFTGGSQMHVTFPTRQTADKLTQALKAGGVSDPMVQIASGGYAAILNTQETTNATDPSTHQNVVYMKMANALATLGQYREDSFDKVSGTVSKELTDGAKQAVLTASILIIVYLAFAFMLGGFVAGLRLGTSAIVAMLHDILVLIGLFSFLGFVRNEKIDSLFVTAVLTVVGFSIHNTVVIFDRVRENLRHQARGETFEHLVNHSVQQTLNRSVRTSGTVAITLLALLLFGGDTTQSLNLALFIGVLSGTYSSIFNAPAVLVDWENWLAKRRAETGHKPLVAAVAGGGAAASGGGSRQVAARPSAPSNGYAAPVENEIGISKIKGKKKKPARRF